MLIFVIPLKSQKVSKSWIQVCKLLERCLSSIHSQSNLGFQIIVVCNEKPILQFDHPNLHFVEANFLVPDSSRQEKEKDRAKKVILGLQYARHFQPKYAMIVDADDCLSGQIVDFVNQNSADNGWVINSGYIYQEESSFIYYRKSHFYSWCGTCNILKFDLWPLSDLDDDYSEYFLEFYAAGNHRNIEKIMRTQGTPINPLPFAGAIYTIGNSENMYQQGFSTIHNSNQGNVGFWLKELLKFRPLTSSIRKEFSLYKI